MNILVVDDTAANRKLLRVMRNWRLKWAPTGGNPCLSLSWFLGGSDLPKVQILSEGWRPGWFGSDEGRLQAATRITVFSIITSMTDSCLPRPLDLAI
jgi:hypothetical protein